MRLMLMTAAALCAAFLLPDGALAQLQLPQAPQDLPNVLERTFGDNARAVTVLVLGAYLFPLVLAVFSLSLAALLIALITLGCGALVVFAAPAAAAYPTLAILWGIAAICAMIALQARSLRQR